MKESKEEFVKLDLNFIN